MNDTSIWPYFKMPSHAFRHEGLQKRNTALKIYCAIYSVIKVNEERGDDSGFFATNTWFCKQFDWKSKGAIARVSENLGFLEDQGFIKRHNSVDKYGKSRRFITLSEDYLKQDQLIQPSVTFERKQNIEFVGFEDRFDTPERNDIEGGVDYPLSENPSSVETESLYTPQRNASYVESEKSITPERNYNNIYNINPIIKTNKDRQSFEENEFIEFFERSRQKEF